MPKRLFKNWLRQYLDYTCHSEAPDAFHFWTGVSVISGALRRRVWIDQRYFQWTPNFYIFFVAPPGVVSKSTTVNVGMALLREVDGIHFGPDAVTWQALTQTLAEAQELVTMDDGMMYPMACLTVVASELGTFFNPQDREMVDVLVSLWDGQRGVWVKSTKTQGVDTIENPWLNIIGCTTPAWIAGNFPEYMIGGGFTSRSVFVYAEKKRQFIAYPALQIPEEEHRIMGDKLVADLRLIAQIKGEYQIEKEALEWGAVWYKDHWTKRPVDMSDDRYGGYIARKQTHIHKLAMVLAAAQRDRLLILKDDLVQANIQITSLEKDMIKVFKSVGAKEEEGHRRSLLHLIRGMKGGIERDRLWRITMSVFRNNDEFEACIMALISANLIRQFTVKGTIYLGAKNEQEVTKDS